MRILLIILTVFIAVGSSNAQMSWSNVQDLVDYKKELKSLLKAVERNSNNGESLAKVGECYYMLNQMKQAQNYFEKAIKANGMRGDYKLQYANTLMALEEYSAAKQWFSSYAKDNSKVGEHYTAQLDKIEILKKIAPIYSVDHSKVNSAQVEMAVSMAGSDVYYLQNHATKGKSLFKILADGSTKKVNPGVELNEVSYFNYSGNGNFVCYTKQETYLGQRAIPEAGLNDELFIAAVSPNGEWVNTQSYTHNKSGFNCSYPALDFDGSTLYFSSNRADGFGGQDVYMSLKNGNTWSFPVNAGSEVNTPGNEITPYPTSSSLYFSSNWNVGYGGYDIYRAAKSGGGYTKVFHQGTGVNSSRDDYGFCFNEKSKTAKFISNRPSGSGLEDIYTASKPDENYVINVKDGSNNSRIDRAAIDLSACGGNQTFTDENGQFVFELLSDSGCRIRIEKPGYEITFVEVSKMRGREYTVLLESNYPTVIGQVLDQSTGMGLASVKVAVENMATKEVQNLVSDNSGSFNCQLISGYTYKIQYFKDGFQPNNKMINTGTKVTSDAIGSVLLSKVAAPIASAPATSIPSAPNPTKNAPTYSQPAPSYTNPNSNYEQQSGYAVQLAAIKPSKGVDKNKYASTNSFGEVYIKEGTDYNRVRVGVFKTKAEADKAKAGIRAAGFSSAYVVKEEGVTLKSGKAAEAAEVYTSRSYTPSPSAVNAEYVIRLAALQNTSNVDRNLLNRYGKVETTLSNNLTVFYLSGFSELGDAEKVKSNLQSQGYPGAFVMKRVNGTLQKIN